MYDTTALLDEFKDFMILKNFSQSTIKSYIGAVKVFLDDCKSKYGDTDLSSEMVKKYLITRFEKGLDWQTVNSDYSAIQKFYKNVIFVEWELKKLPRPRKEKKLPSVFSQEAVIKIINSAATFKQQVLLTFIYATGARLNESINVKIVDIDSQRQQVRINRGKGNKDRLILIPQFLIDLLRVYYKAEKPVEYLFNPHTKGKKYSHRAVQLALSEAKKAAGVIQKGSIRTLRNCYATHHLENGTDLVFLQEQMGHKNLRTTIRYIALCVQRHRYIKHPIETMKINYLHPLG